MTEWRFERTCVWFQSPACLQLLSCPGHPTSSPGACWVIPFHMPLSLTHTHGLRCAWVFPSHAWCQGRINVWVNNSSLPNAGHLSLPLWILWLQPVILLAGSPQTLWTFLTFTHQGSETYCSCYPELIASCDAFLLLEHPWALNHSWSSYFIRDVFYLGWRHSTLNHLSFGVKVRFLTHLIYSPR